MAAGEESDNFDKEFVRLRADCPFEPAAQPTAPRVEAAMREWSAKLALPKKLIL